MLGFYMSYFLNSWRHLFPLFFISFIIVGCGAAETTQPSPATISPQATQQTQGYPGPESAYPAPEIIDSSGLIVASEPENPLQLPAPSEGLATFGGKIVNQRTNKAPEESIVYLGDILYTDTGLPVIRLDRQIAPFAILEESGEFVFKDVFPAEYSVVFFTPDASFPIDDADTGQTLILNLEPNDIVDLGLVEIPVR